MTRSGDTPKAILGGTTGTVVVADMYTGYNAITGVEVDNAPVANSHARWKFFTALIWRPKRRPPSSRSATFYVIKIARETGEVGHPRAPAGTRREQCSPNMDKLYV